MATTYNLSKGALQILMAGVDYVNPILQILRSTKISEDLNRQCYCCILSDGRNTIPCAIVNVVGSDGIPNFTVIKGERCVVKVIKRPGKGNVLALRVLDMQVIAPGQQVGRQIGSLIPLLRIDSIVKEVPSTSCKTIFVAKPMNVHDMGLPTLQNSRGLKRPISSLNTTQQCNPVTYLYNLSEGALQIIMRDDDYEGPIMQILDIKKIISIRSDKECYRILLSDGINTISFAILSIQVNDEVDSASIPNFTVIKIRKYITSVINDSNKGVAKMLLILDMEVVKPGNQVGEQIGSPVPLLGLVPNLQAKTSSSSNIPVAVPLNFNSTRCLTTLNRPTLVLPCGSLIHPYKRMRMTNTYNLSEGAIQIIMTGGYHADPVLQVLRGKRISCGNFNNSKHYRLLLSDGKHATSHVVLQVQKCNKVGSGGIQNFTVIKIKSYVSRVLNIYGKNEAMLYIFDIQIIAPGEQVGERIGSPTPFLDTRSNNQGMSSLSCNTRSVVMFP